MVKRYELSNEQWGRIEDLLPGKKGDPGRSGQDNRLFVNAVLWVLRSGARWSDLPERYGKWKTVHNRETRRGGRAVPFCSAQGRDRPRRIAADRADHSPLQGSEELKMFAAGKSGHGLRRGDVRVRM